MLTIKQNSWHYKLHRFFYTKDSSNLCNYFWSNLLGICALILAPVLALLILIVKIFTNKSNDITPPIFLYFLFAVISFIGGLGVLGSATLSLLILAKGMLLGSLIFLGAILLLIILFLIVHVVDENKHKFKIFKFKEDKKDKKPNLIWEFIKATKNKYCPLITYK